MSTPSSLCCVWLYFDKSTETLPLLMPAVSIPASNVVAGKIPKLWQLILIK